MQSRILVSLFALGAAFISWSDAALYDSYEPDLSDDLPALTDKQPRMNSYTRGEEKLILKTLQACYDGDIKKPWGIVTDALFIARQSGRLGFKVQRNQRAIPQHFHHSMRYRVVPAHLIKKYCVIIEKEEADQDRSAPQQALHTSTTPWHSNGDTQDEPDTALSLSQPGSQQGKDDPDTTLKL